MPIHDLLRMGTYPHRAMFEGQPRMVRADPALDLPRLRGLLGLKWTHLTG